MRDRIDPQAWLISAAYGLLVFIPMQRPGMVSAALLQLAICACLLALCLLLVAYREELRDIVMAALPGCLRFLFTLPLSGASALHSATESAPPCGPSLSPLFQRPPPFLA